MRSSRLLTSAGLLMIGIGLWAAFVSPSSPTDYSTEVVLSPHPEARQLTTPPRSALGPTGGQERDQAGEAGHVRALAADTETTVLSSSGVLAAPSVAAQRRSDGLTDAAIAEIPGETQLVESAAPKPAHRYRRKAAQRAAKPGTRQASHSFEHPLGTR